MKISSRFFTIRTRFTNFFTGESLKGKISENIFTSALDKMEFVVYSLDMLDAVETLSLKRAALLLSCAASSSNAHHWGEGCSLLALSKTR